MDAQRPFPPSPRRVALARRAGLTAASPIAVGAAAWLGALGALLAVGAASAGSLRTWIADACAGRAHALGVEDAAGAVIAIALPIAAAAALAAIGVHFAQTRTAWLPRRRVEGAPALSPARARDGALELVRAAAIGAVVLGWLWWAAPRLVVLFGLPFASPGNAATTLSASAALVASALAAMAIAIVALAAIDALVRAADVGRALFMTPEEKREDDRSSGPDPRWRRLRDRLARDAAPLGATAIVIIGDDIAVAIAWDPVRRPTPERTARGTGLRATQLVARARAGRIPIHRDPALAAALAKSRAIPEQHWPRLAEIVAAVRR